MLSAAPRLLPGRIRGAAWGDRAVRRLPLPEEIRDGEEFLGRSGGRRFQLLRCRPRRHIPHPRCCLATMRPDPAPSTWQTCWGLVPAPACSAQHPLAFPPPTPTSCYKNHRSFLQPRSSRSNRQERRGFADSNTDVTLGRVRLKVFNQTSRLHIHFIFWFEIQSL